MYISDSILITYDYLEDIIDLFTQYYDYKSTRVNHQTINIFSSRLMTIIFNNSIKCCRPSK